MYEETKETKAKVVTYKKWSESLVKEIFLRNQYGAKRSKEFMFFKLKSFVILPKQKKKRNKTAMIIDYGF